MLSVLSRIWTHVAVSISYDDNPYTTGTSGLYRVQNTCKILCVTKTYKSKVLRPWYLAYIPWFQHKIPGVWYICLMIYKCLVSFAQSPGVIEYTDSPPKSILDMTPNNLMLRFQWRWRFVECGVPLSLPSLTDPLRPGVVAHYLWVK